MATFRPVKIDYWQDPFITELTPEEKYFYLYLITNSRTTQCGIYEISMKLLDMETGYNRDTILKLLDRFTHEYKKILYSSETNEILLLNWIKNNPITNTNIRKCVEKELKNVKNQDFIVRLCKLISESKTVPEMYPSIMKNENNIINPEGNSKPILSPLHDPTKKEEEEEEEEEEKEETSPEPEEKTSGGVVPYKSIMELYNTVCVRLPKIKSIENNRQKKVKVLWKSNPDIVYFQTLFNAVNDSNFLSGENDRAWTADFDWIIEPRNRVKVLEGNYKNRQLTPQTTKSNIVPMYANFEQREYNEEDLKKFYANLNG